MAAGVVSEPLTAFIIALNEELTLPACIAALEGVDEIVVADGGSTDRTKEVAESLGATWFLRNPHRCIVTAENVAGFVERFGWAPSFTEGFEIVDGDKEYAEAITHATHDWVVTPDADEIVTWDLSRIRKDVLPNADQVVCWFANGHDENGKPASVGTRTKMFRKSLTKYAGRTHGCPLPAGRVMQVPAEVMFIDHWRPPVKSQDYVLPILEYSVFKEDAQRDRFYLGREYYFKGEWARGLTLLDLYLSRATWMHEIAQARLYAAGCYWELGRGDEARKSCLEAVLINPDHRTALSMLSEMYDEPWKSKWAFIAENATNKDILF
jgi:glycosyltransferase involved in cell wall biosynthesis